MYKKTQKQRILELLADGRWHNTIEMNKIAYRYSAILFDLRREGYTFSKKRDPAFPDNIIEMWCLGSVPKAILIKQPKYILAPEGDRYIEAPEPLQLSPQAPAETYKQPIQLTIT